MFTAYHDDTLEKHVTDDSSLNRVSQSHKSTGLYISNLPLSVDDDDLASFFGQDGGLRAAFIVLDRETDHPTGAGYVSYDDDWYAERAIDTWNGQRFGDGVEANLMGVEWAEDRPADCAPGSTWPVVRRVKEVRRMLALPERPVNLMSLPDEVLLLIVGCVEDSHLFHRQRRLDRYGDRVSQGFGGLSRPLLIAHVNRRLRRLSHSTWTTMILITTNDYLLNFHSQFGILTKNTELAGRTRRVVFCITTPLPRAAPDSPFPYHPLSAPDLPNLAHTFVVARHAKRTDRGWWSYNSELRLNVEDHTREHIFSTTAHRLHSYEKARLVRLLTPKHTLHLDTSVFPFDERFVDEFASAAEQRGRGFAIRLAVYGRDEDDVWLNRSAPNDADGLVDEGIRPPGWLADKVLGRPISEWLTSNTAVHKIEIVGDGTHPLGTCSLYEALGDMLLVMREADGGVLDPRVCWVGEEPGVEDFTTVQERWLALGRFHYDPHGPFDANFKWNDIKAVVDHWRSCDSEDRGPDEFVEQLRTMEPLMNW